MKSILHKKFSIYLIFILIIQIVLLIYWGNEKSNYYWDEYYSFDNAHYYASMTPERAQLDSSEVYKTDTWIPVTSLKDTYLVTKDSSVLYDEPSFVIKKFLSYKPYMGVLNIVETLFFDGEINKWSGISINIVIFVMGQILLYHFVNAITNRKDIALLSVIMYGFSGMAISMVEFVRMYLWVSTTVILVTFIHFKIWMQKKIIRNILWELLGVAIIYIAYLDSPLMLLYASGLIGFFCIGLLIKKRYVQFVYYFVPLLIVGGGYLLFCTDYIETLFQQNKYMNSETTPESIVALLENIARIDAKEIGLRISYLVKLYGDYLFGSTIILGILGVLVIVLFIKLIKNESIKEVLFKSEEKQFLYIWLGAVVTFWILTIYLGATLTRYNSPVFSSVACLVVVFIMLLGRKVKNEKATKYIMVLLILVSILITNCVPKIENIYREDREIIELVKNMQCDSVVWNGNVIIVNDCISWMNEEYNIYISNNSNLINEQFPEEFLLWSYKELEQEELMNLEGDNYKIVKFGKTYISNIYYCEEVEK